jgi:hypothetical protein
LTAWLGFRSGVAPMKSRLLPAGLPEPGAVLLWSDDGPCCRAWPLMETGPLGPGRGGEALSGRMFLWEEGFPTGEGSQGRSGFEGRAI